MRSIATALKVSPADLISNAALAEVAGDEVEPVEAGNPVAALSSSLATLGVRVYRVTDAGKSLVKGGIGPGDFLVVSASPERIEARKLGDILLVRVAGDGEKPGPIVLRLFVPPDQLLTLRNGPNLVIGLDDEDFRPEIVGVVVRDA